MPRSSGAKFPLSFRPQPFSSHFSNSCNSHNWAPIKSAQFRSGVRHGLFCEPRPHSMIEALFARILQRQNIGSHQRCAPPSFGISALQEHARKVHTLTRWMHSLTPVESGMISHAIRRKAHQPKSRVKGTMQSFEIRHCCKIVYPASSSLLRVQSPDSRVRSEPRTE
jgi:hypothetical protein